MEWKDAFNYGVPTALLAGFVLGLWRVLVWARDKVVEPVVKNHMELIDTLKTHMPRQTGAIEEQTAEIKGQTKLLEDRTGLFEKIVGNQERIIGTEDKVAGMLEEMRRGKGGAKQK